MLTLGLLLGGLEGGLDRNTWRYATSADKAYFQALRTWGYPLSEVELLVLGEAEPTPADGEDAPVGGDVPVSEAGQPEDQVDASDEEAPVEDA